MVVDHCYAQSCIDSSFISLRSICDSDKALLLRIYASTRQEEGARAGVDPNTWGQLLQLQFELQHAQYMANYIRPSFDLIVIDNTPVGRLYVNRQQQEIRLVDISLLPEYRGQGIGRVLLQRLIEEARANNCCIGLHVDRDNPILDFYLRLGFQVEADRGIYLYLRVFP